jgi:hypothetical protein
MSAELTRGEANNNPGNIVRDTTAWLGLVPSTAATDRRFCQFDTAVNGIRALAKVLLSYQRLDGCRVLAELVGRYAPKSANDTESYLRDIVARSGITAGQALDLEHPGELALLTRAIIFHENGRCLYDEATIAGAVTAALAS